MKSIKELDECYKKTKRPLTTKRGIQNGLMGKES